MLKIYILEVLSVTWVKIFIMYTTTAKICNIYKHVFQYHKEPGTLLDAIYYTHMHKYIFIMSIAMKAIEYKIVPLIM